MTTNKVLKRAASFGESSRPQGGCAAVGWW